MQKAEPMTSNFVLACYRLCFYSLSGWLSNTAFTVALMIFEEMKRKEAAKIAFIGMNPIGVKLA